MKRVFVALAVSLLVVLALTLWWQVSLSPVDPSNPKTQDFIITQGDGVREIANNLHNAGLIRDQVAFFLLVKKLGIEKNIQAGSYKLSPSWSAQTLAEKLTVGTEDFWVTVPEGWRSEEILDYLQSQGVDAGKWTPSSQLAKWKADEGYLFPDTYLIPKLMTIDNVHALFKQNFASKFTPAMQAAANKNGLTLEQATTVASLVEREARTAADRPLVASVIYNRLKAGIALNIDATVQYALGKVPGDGWWKKDLTADDLQFNSPYNTYLNPGLPPGPICNPGLASLQAAVYPAQTDYLYYLSDKNFVMHYAKTLAEHNANVAKYLQ